MKPIDKLFFKFEIVHKSGDRLFPERIANKSGELTYRWFRRGNLNADSHETHDVNEVISQWLNGKGVRCSTKNGSRKGIFKRTGPSILTFVDGR